MCIYSIFIAISLLIIDHPTEEYLSLLAYIDIHDLTLKKNMQATKCLFQDFLYKKVSFFKKKVCYRCHFLYSSYLHITCQFFVHN